MDTPQQTQPSQFSGYRLVIIETVLVNGRYTERSRCSKYYPTLDDLLEMMRTHSDVYLGKKIRIVYSK